MPIPYGRGARSQPSPPTGQSANRPVPTNDLWIDAHALETGAGLGSFDSHFGHVEGLAWVNPGS